MSNQIYGILTIALCSIGYFYSWKYQKKDNFKIAIFLLVICGFVLRLFTSADFFLHSWDECYHALVAKNLINHPLVPTLYDNPVLSYGFKNWTENYIWLHKQPLPLWTMAASMWMFGINEIALRLPSIILTTLGIWLTYYISKFFYNKKIGYVAAFLFSINGLIIELTAGRTPTDHIDTFFLFFIELAILFSILFVQKKKFIYNILVGISIGAAILSKWMPALIVLPIWLLIVIDYGNFKPKTIILQFILIIITCTIIFLPWQLYIFHAFPLEANWEASFNFKHITESLEGQGQPFYFFIDRIKINYGELIYLPLLWFLWKAFKNLKDYKRLAICIWFLIPFIFFTITKTKMQGYILFTCPALFMMISEFWHMLSDYKRKHKLKWLFNIVLFFLIALPIRYTLERIRPFEDCDRNIQRVTDLKKLNDKNYKNGVLLNYEKQIDAMYYTNLIAYHYIPDKKVITDLIEKGYIVIINDNNKIPEEIKSIKGIILEKISSDD